MQLMSRGPLKPTIHYATDCNKAVTKLKQSCNTLVSALLQFVACNMLHSVWPGLQSQRSTRATMYYTVILRLFPFVRVLFSSGEAINKKDHCTKLF